MHLYILSEQFFFQTVERKQLEQIIMVMPSNKVPSLDKIPIHVIKDYLPNTLYIVF